MKFFYTLIISILMLATTAIQAQSPRTVLFEEFTGENCGPCAGTNPWLKRFSDLNAQDSFLHMAYQSPIPSAGPIYNAYKTDADARITYYGVNFAPWGENDGRTWPSTWTTATNHPITYMDSASLAPNSATANITSIGFNQRRTISSPCAINITHWFSPNFDSVFAMAIVTTTATYKSLATSSLKFQMVLTEKQLVYGTPPGTNGETTFENVVRKMYPTNAGTTMADSNWVGKIDTFKVAALIPSYVRERGQIQFIGFVQDNNSKEVKQAGSSVLAPITGLVDILAFGDSVQGIACTNASSAPIYSYISVKNTGGVTITAMNVKVYDGTSLINTIPWTGSLLSGDIVQVNIGPLTLSGGQHTLKFVAGNPNGANVHSATYDTVKPITFIAGTSSLYPYTQDFEVTTSYPPANCYSEGETANGKAWYPSYAWGTTGNTYYGAESTIHSTFYYNWGVAPGEIGNFYLPKVDLTTAATAYITFWHCHQQHYYNGNLIVDQMELQTSTDCGTTWTSVWNKSGAALATIAAPTANPTASYKPKAAIDWIKDSVPLNTVATHNNVWMRFHATSGGGNSVWIDQINIDQSSTVGINEIENVEIANVFPSPANENVTLELGLTKVASYEVSIINTLGEVVKMVSNGELSQGVHRLEVNSKDIASGIYNFIIRANDQKIVKRFVVAH